MKWTHVTCVQLPLTHVSASSPQDVGASSALLRLLLPHSREGEQAAVCQPADEPPAEEHPHPIQHVRRPD